MRGMSLLETVIATALAAVLALVLLQLVNSGAKLYARGQARADLQAAGLVALSELTREAKDAAGATAAIWSGTGARADAAVSFRPDPRPGPLSPFQPQEHVIVFREVATGRLIRTTLPLVGTGTRLNATQLRSACETPTTQERVVCTFTTRMALQLSPMLLHVRLDLAQPVRNGVVAKETVETSVAFRNRT